jgi:hypothetical protein
MIPLLLLAFLQTPMTDAEIWQKVAQNLAAPTWYDPALTAAAIAAQTATPPPVTEATWTIEGGALPPGLALGTDGRISGTPTAAGSYTVTIRANIPGIGVIQRQFTITIEPALVIDPAPPPGRVGISYRFQFATQEK